MKLCPVEAELIYVGGLTDGHTKAIIYKEPTRCNFRQYSFLLTIASTLYMFFRRFLRPSSGVLKTVVAATGACQDIQGRSTTPYHIIYPNSDMK